MKFKTKNLKCRFTEEKDLVIDYKNVSVLRQYMSKHFKIVPRYYTGTSLKFQKKLALEIKKARFMGLLPYVRKV